MHISENNIAQVAELYSEGKLSAADKAAVEEKMANDEGYAREFSTYLKIYRELNDYKKQQKFQSLLREVAQETKTGYETIKQPESKNTKTIALRTHYLRIAGVAAGVALLTSGISTGWLFNHTEKSNNTQYKELKKVVREIEHIKNEQSKILKDIKNPPVAIPAPAVAQYSGTGFALSNDGYVLTNAHVTQNADSILIKTNKGSIQKAFVVAYDEKSDLALLKIENKHFRFGKGDVPYTFASSKLDLGTKVYTIGYPQDEVVYNEGYISSRNGYEGDSLQYRISISAEAGQSGSPVLDEHGNLIALITGQKTGSNDVTFAVSSQSVLKLLENLPNANKMQLPKNNKLKYLSRQAQISKMQEYTCMIQVFKN